jgi:hypothetical protein
VTGGGAHVTLDTQIEQMIARGRSLTFILAHLPVTTGDIDRAIDRMNAACTEDGAWEDRRRGARGPADPATLAALVDAVCPPQPTRAANLRRKAVGV